MGWQFGGNIGHTLSQLGVASGADALGHYSEIGFDYSVETARHGAIRSYSNRPAVLFSITYTQASPNSAPFPTFRR